MCLRFKFAIVSARETIGVVGILIPDLIDRAFDNFFGAVDQGDVTAYFFYDAILWVEKIMVVPFFRNSNISFFRSSTLIGSKPLKGSSKISISGSCRTVVMELHLLCHSFG